ncbi:hypothetical protein D3C78_1488320 [compost metagenome]
MISGGRSMGVSMLIEGLDSEENIIEMNDESLISIEYQHHTKADAMARSLDTGYILNISGALLHPFVFEDTIFKENIL